MAVTRSQKTGIDDVLHPFIPPKGDACYIKNLPLELLLRIFQFSCAYMDFVRIVEADTSNYWDKFFEWKGAENGDDVGVGQESECDDEDADDAEDVDDDETDNGAYSEGPSDTSEPFGSCLLVQVILTHVCHRWRDSALSDPTLWTSIYVTSRTPLPYGLVSAQLERSKNLPIDINLNCHYEDCEERPSDADFLFLFNILIPHIHRWRDVEVSFEEYRVLYSWLNAVSGSSIPPTQVETVQLFDFTHEVTKEYGSFQYPTMSKHFALFTGSIPSLTTVNLWGVHVDWSQPWIASASNLESLCLAFHPEDVRPSWAQFATILRGASALERLVLSESGPSGDPAKWFIEPIPGSPADLNAPIQLPQVTDFSLRCHSQVYALGLLHRLYFPAIKSLSLNLCGDDYTNFVEELARPITSPSLSLVHERPPNLLSRLDNLEIYRFSCKSESIGTLYDELENLTSLRLSMRHIPSDFLRYLAKPRTSTEEGDVWLPRLATLYISGACARDLRVVVQTRKEAGAPLSSLYVGRFCAVIKEDVEWLRERLETFQVMDDL